MPAPGSAAPRPLPRPLPPRAASPRRRAFRWAVVLLAAALVLVGGFALRDVTNPLLLGLLLAYILNPLVEGLERRGISRRIAVPVLFAAVLALVMTAVGFTSVKAAGRLIDLRKRLVGERVLDPANPADAKLIEAAKAGAPPVPIGVAEWPDGEPKYFLDLDGDGERRMGLVEQVALYATEQLALGKDDLARVARGFEEHASAFTEWGVRLTRGMQRSLSELGLFFVYVLLVPLYSFFLLQSFGSLRDSFRDHLPGAYREQVVDIARKIDLQVAAFFRGKLIVALVKGAAVSLGLSLIGVPFAVTIGMSVGALSILPVIGPLLGGALAVVLSYAGPDGFLLQVVLIVGVIGLGEAVEAVTQPVILGREVGLSALSIILSLFVFGKLFGLFGLILAVPIACIVKTLFRELVLPQIRALADEPPAPEGPPEHPGPAGPDGPAVPTFRRRAR